MSYFTLRRLFYALSGFVHQPTYGGGSQHLGRAPGTAHFRTTIAHGQSLMRELRRRYSGLCQPTYVRDGPEGEGKVPVGLI